MFHWGSFAYCSVAYIKFSSIYCQPNSPDKLGHTCSCVFLPSGTCILRYLYYSHWDLLLHIYRFLIICVYPIPHSCSHSANSSGQISNWVFTCSATRDKTFFNISFVYIIEVHRVNCKKSTTHLISWVY